MIITIDGPSGSGKSTVAKMFARKVKDIKYFDSGSLYRILTWLKINKKPINLKSVKLKLDNEGNQYFWQNQDITHEIRSEAVNNAVSEISTNIEIRKLVNEFLRELVKFENLIMDGRDLGTYVFPKADLKIYLDAPVAARAKRRQSQNFELKIYTNYEDVLSNIQKRDQIDSQRKIAPLKIPKDAIIIENDENTKISDIVNEIKSYYMKLS